MKNPLKKKALTQEERNAKFNALPPKKKMVAIAKDVLMQLALEKYDAGYTYLKIRKVNEHIDPNKLDSAKAQALALSEDVRCEVCARGAIVMSRCRLGNTLDGNDLACGDYVNDVPFGVLELSERLYENWNNNQGDGHKFDIIDRERFILKDLSRADRLRRIMQNFIDNKGDLVFEGVNFTASYYENFDHNN